MCDATGEPPDRLHLLSLTELILELYMLGYITKYKHRAGDVAGAVTNRRAAIAD